jgi:hypothetical protein
MKKTQWLILVAALVLSLGIGSTVAFIVASSNVVQNTFTVGNVSISLNETTGSEYVMAPGTILKKNPTVTVEKGSDACWLFVRMQKTAGFDDYCTCEIDGGWTLLNGQNGVFYRKVDRAEAAKVYRILKDDRVFVKDTLTEEQLGVIQVPPTLSFTAYAIQREGIDTPQQAWQLLNP